MVTLYESVVTCLFCRLPEECGDRWTLPLCQYVDGQKFLPGCSLYHACLRKFRFLFWKHFPFSSFLFYFIKDNGVYTVYRIIFALYFFFALLHLQIISPHLRFMQKQVLFLINTFDIQRLILIRSVLIYTVKGLDWIKLIKNALKTLTSLGMV